MADCRAVVDTTRVLRRTLAGLVCGLVLASAACSSGDHGTAGAGGARSEAGDAAEPTGPFATGRRTLTLVAPSRGTAEVAGVLPARPVRTFVVEVVYPAEGAAAAEPTAPGAPLGSVEDAPPAEGTFPLVVFAHGFNGEGWFFRGYAEGWARAGYVVALPTFPLSRNGIAVSADAANQPRDVSFVIDEIAALGEDDPLAGHVDARRVAVGGHSLGGATVLGATYNSCCADRRVDAVVQVSGGPLPFEGGAYDSTSETPMLLVHGTADETVPVAVGDAVFDMFDVPIWYLRAEGATHSGVFEGVPGELFDDAVLAFLDAELRGDGEGLDAMAGEVEASGTAEWRVRPAPG